MKDLRKHLIPGASGTLTWTWGAGGHSRIGYRVSGSDRLPAIHLQYRLADGEDVNIAVRLTRTPTQFNGFRWWFTCPLIMRGVPCNRRSGKLYLPPSGSYFGCRKCHDLTYRSSQRAHRTERLFGRLGLQLTLARLRSRNEARKLH
ncbi:MAG: hypothetical protein U0840_08555 [Gemmataceae bacterium]